MAKVMLVEDDNNLREIYEARMQAEGYEVVSAKDGEEALVVAKAEKPELIISDVMMPKISGFEMLDILRNTDGMQAVKVIMLTALGQADDQQRADRLGADRYLVKSQVTLEDIVNVAHQLLGDSPAETPAVSATVETAPIVNAAPTPVASTSAAPEPVTTPVVAAPTPVIAAPTVTTPVAASPIQPVAAPVIATSAPGTFSAVQVEPEPVAAPAAISQPTAAASDDGDAGAQTSAQEEATVEAQIEKFVASPVDTLPAPTTESAPITSDGVAAAESAANTAADDQLMADAVNDLVASAATNSATVAGASSSESPVASAAPQTVIQPAAQATPVAQNPTTATTNVSAADAAPSVVGKKVISPITDNVRPDLNDLLAKEEAKEILAASPVAVPQPVAAAPAPTPPSATELTPAAPEKSASAGEVKTDPNSISL